MNLILDTSRMKFVVTRAPGPKVDQAGIQRAEKATGEPLWSTQFVVTDDSGGEIIAITTAGKCPDVEVGDEVEIDHLVTLAWATNGKSGLSFRADGMRPVS